MRRALLLAVTGVLTVSLAGGALADVASFNESDPQALELLTAAAHAGRESSYEGTQVVMLWLGDRQRSASVRVRHLAGSGSLIEVEPTPGTRGRTVFVPVGTATSGLDGPSEAALDLVRRNFVVALDGTDEVLGRQVDVVLVRTRAGRPVQRLWIDRRTALTLRRTLYDEASRMVRQTAFVALSERTPEFTAAQSATGPVPARTRTVDAAGLRVAGWQVPAAPDGLVAYDAVVTGAGPAAVLHLAYTDGIETLSLFEQHGRLDVAAVRGWRRTTIGGVKAWVSPGYPHRAIWSAADHVYTLVTECDARSIETLVRSLPRGQQSDGFSPRVRRGVHRVASWINPAR